MTKVVLIRTVTAIDVIDIDDWDGIAPEEIIKLEKDRDSSEVLQGLFDAESVTINTEVKFIG